MLFPSLLHTAQLNIDALEAVQTHIYSYQPQHLYP